MKVFLLASQIFSLAVCGPSFAASASQACLAPLLGPQQPCPGQILAVVQNNGHAEAILDNIDHQTYRVTSGGEGTGTICQFYCYSSLGSTKLHAQVTKIDHDTECSYDANVVYSGQIDNNQLVPIGSPKTPVSGQVLASDPNPRIQACGGGPAAFFGNFYTNW
jgi:hypothetical protein